MLYFIGLLAVTLPVVILVMARGKPDHYERQVAEQDEHDDWKRDRPAGPGAESQAVPAAGSIGPAAAPPQDDDRR